MSIYRLGSDAWIGILVYLDGHDIVALLLSGDYTLRSIMKPAIRDFSVSFATTTSPRLSSLLSLLKDCELQLSLLSIGVEPVYEELAFLPEDYKAEKWKQLFTENLSTLKLDLNCTQPPFSSLLACLSTLAPHLKELYVADFSESLDLPNSLTFLELDFPAAYLSGIPESRMPMPLERLPTTLTTLKLPVHLSLVSDIVAEKITFKKMALTVLQGNIIFSSLRKNKHTGTSFPILYCSCMRTCATEIDRIHSKNRNLGLGSRCFRTLQILKYL